MAKVTLTQTEMQEAFDEALRDKEAEARRNTIRKDMIKLCNKAKKLGVGFHVSMFTNGTLEPQINITGGYSPRN
jgi:hypothetical protein